jgi:hypothetical protein
MAATFSAMITPRRPPKAVDGLFFSRMEREPYVTTHIFAVFPTFSQVIFTFDRRDEPALPNSRLFMSTAMSRRVKHISLFSDSSA